MQDNPNDQESSRIPKRKLGARAGLASALGLALLGGVLALGAASASAVQSVDDPPSSAPAPVTSDPSVAKSDPEPEELDLDKTQALSEDPAVVSSNPNFGAEFDKKITICHRTGDWTKPYVEVTVSRWAIVHKNGSPNTDPEKGHGGHLGKPFPIEDPWGDIIPAFDPVMFKDWKVWAGYDGLNTSEYGKFILANDCNLKPTLERGIATVSICHRNEWVSTLPYGTAAVPFELKMFRLMFFKDVYTPWKIIRNSDFIQHYGHTGAVWPGTEGKWGDIIPPLDKWDIKKSSESLVMGDAQSMMDGEEMEEIMRRPDYAAGLNYNTAGIGFLGRNCQLATVTPPPTTPPTTTVVTVPGPTVSATATVTATPSAAATPTATPVITPEPAVSPTAEPVVVTPEAATAPTAVNAGDGSSAPQSGLPLWAMALAAVAAIGAAGASVRLATKKN